MDACLDQEIVGLDLLAQPVVGSLSFWDAFRAVSFIIAPHLCGAPLFVSLRSLFSHVVVSLYSQH